LLQWPLPCKPLEGRSPGRGVLPRSLGGKDLSVTGNLLAFSPMFVDLCNKQNLMAPWKKDQQLPHSDGILL
jgi:hypothetical protein